MQLIHQNTKILLIQILINTGKCVTNHLRTQIISSHPHFCFQSHNHTAVNTYTVNQDHASTWMAFQVPPTITISDNGTEAVCQNKILQFYLLTGPFIYILCKTLTWSIMVSRHKTQQQLCNLYITATVSLTSYHHHHHHRRLLRRSSI